MKKHGVLASTIFLVFSLSGWAGADLFEFRSETPFYLEHGYYYTWGIDWALPQGEQIISASLHFQDISNRDLATNDLYLQLLPQAATTPEVIVWDDTVGPGNFFLTLPNSGIELDHWSNLPNTPVTMTYVFDANEVNSLMQYVLDGNFGVGFDPDCFYNPENITLSLETQAIPVPSSVLLSAFGLIGIVGVRKKKRMPKTVSFETDRIHQGP